VGRHEGEREVRGMNTTDKDIRHLRLNCMGRPGCERLAVWRVVLVKPLRPNGYYTVNLCLCAECAELDQETLLGFHRAK
jgi:hypothetical protein